MLTDEEFRLFRDLIYEESGIYLKETRKDFLENRLGKRLTATGIGSPYRYFKHVQTQRTSELLTLLDLLTVNETSFFRNQPQLDLFRDRILPELARRKQSDPVKKLRIWSAGCSTGEEPYTISMILLDSLMGLPNWDIKIYASDLSLSVLNVANKGEYAEDKVLNTVDDRHIARYFEKAGDRYRVRNEVRKPVVFDFHNLKNDNGLRALDVIFCRNVMIYFDQAEQLKLVNKFAASLNPGGYLVPGHAESLQGMKTPFRLLFANGGTAYVKTEQKGNS
jgi:chemotaxis protein methyltransferase CheR